MGDDLPELGIDGNQDQSLELDDTQIRSTKNVLKH